MNDFRNASLAELKIILDWAAEEGWNPGLKDAEAFFAADPNGFFVAVDDSNTPVASISVVNHTPHFAFLGLYIVRAKFRGQGIGLGLWNHALHHAGQRVIGLDGVETQQDNYQASGFQYAGGTTRFSGMIIANRSNRVTQSAAEHIPSLIHLEAAASGVSKPAYLQRWLSKAGARTTYVVREGTEIRAFCTVRACRTGAKIGPLVAETPKEAQDLIEQAAADFEGPICLDVPEAATELSTLCTQLGLLPGFKTARMYRGTFRASTHKCYAVASLELG